MNKLLPGIRLARTIDRHPMHTSEKTDAFSKYQLPISILQFFKRRFGKENTEHLDFRSRHSSFDERNNLIASLLTKRPSWILDIGSNVGDTSNDLADRGHYVVGIEKFAPERQIAAQNAAAGAAFLRASVTPEFIRLMPQWDCILLLSVLHRIYAFEGERYMLDVLQECGKKTDRLFIEGSCRHERYTDQGKPPPDFVSLDVDSASEYHAKIFHRALGDAWDIAPAVRLKCSKKEPFRLLFHAVRVSS
jgi:SAM-dependent methyltransferase